MKRAQLRKLYATCGVLSLQLKYDSASCLKCDSTLIIDDIDIAGSRVMINIIFNKQFISRFRVANYIFITRNCLVPRRLFNILILFSLLIMKIIAIERKRRRARKKAVREKKGGAREKKAAREGGREGERSGDFFLLLSFPFPPSLARRPSHRFFYRAAFFWRDNYSLAAFPSALAFHLLSFRVRAVLRDQETPVEEAAPETRTRKLQFSKHDKPLLYHPTHRHILF